LPLYPKTTTTETPPTNKPNLRRQQTGCLGCASGKNAGPRNIFGTKYGQNLAAVQIAREKRRNDKWSAPDLPPPQAAASDEEESPQQQQPYQPQQHHNNDDDNVDVDDDASTDVEEEANEEEDDDFGPSPAAGIWAGSQKLVQESEKIANDDDGPDDNNNNGNNNNIDNDPEGEAETDHDDDGDGDEQENAENDTHDNEDQIAPPATKKTRVD
jgi:hypothetical protein